MSLTKLPRLTTLEFADNGSAWTLEHTPFIPITLQNACSATDSVVQARVMEPALLLLGFAAARHTVLRSLHFVNPEHTSQHDTAGWMHTTGEMQGQWKTALKLVAGAICNALGENLQHVASNGAVNQTGAGPAAGQQQQHQEQQLEQLVGSMRVETAVGGALPVGTTAPDLGQHGAILLPADAGSRSAAGRSSSGLSDAARWRLLVLVQRLQGARQQQQEGGEDGVLGLLDTPNDVVAVPSLSQGEAAEVLQLLLPGLHSLYFSW
jgi:hypothetical protein